MLHVLCTESGVATRTVLPYSLSLSLSLSRSSLRVLCTKSGVVTTDPLPPLLAKPEPKPANVLYQLLATRECNSGVATRADLSPLLD